MVSYGETIPDLSFFINAFQIYLFGMLGTEVCSVQSGVELCIYKVAQDFLLPFQISDISIAF